VTLDKSSYVAKDKLRVKIETQRERVVGFVHVLYRHRASDLLNDESRFIPVTEAVITPLGAEGPANEVPFLAINKDHVVTLFEIEARA